MTKKQLRVVITLGTNSFNSAGDNQIILQGYRTSVNCETAGWVQTGTMSATIYGMSESDMNAATSYVINNFKEEPNTIIVYAIDGDREDMVFAGNIVKAWPDYGRMPDVAFVLQAQAARSGALAAVAPRSFRGTVDVAQVMRQIATSMGYSFENSGVNVKLTDIYLDNTDLEQARDLAKMADIEMHIDRNILSIWPKGSYRNAVVPLISADTGMVSYPAYDGTYVTFTTLYNPAIISGGLVKIESDNKNCNGTWQVLKMTHRLESERPNGAWFSNVIAVSLNYGR